jgi:hypothetical protein
LGPLRSLPFEIAPLLHRFRKRFPDLDRGIVAAAEFLPLLHVVDPMKDAPSKLFASAYALFSGVVFLSAMSIVLSPIFHRILHHFHLDDESDDAT